MIKNIIFDLGNVLLDVQYNRFRDVIYSNNVSKEEYDNFFLDGNYRIIGYEAGQITTDEFISRCLNTLSLKMSTEEFSGAFNNIFVEITPMKELLLKLAEDKSHNLFLLSNTSPMHFEYVKQNFSFLSSLNKFGLSYELKCLKPEETIFERAIKYFDVSPDECLFIDDLYDNCKSAEKFGIKTIVYDKNDHASFVKKLQKFIQ